MKQKSGLKVESGDLDDLPIELISQLNAANSKTKIEEIQFCSCIEKLGGEAIIDKVMIQYWRDYKLVLDRAKANQRLFKMVQKGLLFSHPKNKGVYNTNAY